MLHLERYTPARAGIWNEFVAGSKNGTFLFDRNYMDYHADRFQDHSLLIWDDAKLLGLLPANEREGRLFSHGGLTYGGVIANARMRAATMLEIFALLRVYLKEQQFDQLLYKAVPHIYHRLPAEEDLYALFVNGAKLVRRDVSSTIDLQTKLDLTKGRKWSMNKARSSGLTIRESQEIRAFMAIEEAHLLQKYGVKPTHTADEMERLAARFPQSIRLFGAFAEDRMVGGVLVYQSARVAHAQYIAATEEGRERGSLDAIMDELLTRVYPGAVPYFDFGISTEKGGTYLNAGLIDNKESYGARATVHDFYELAPAA